MPEGIREIHTRLILGKFLAREPQIISELEKSTGISKTTIIKIVAKLTRAGILVAEGKAGPSEEKGRRPIVYSLNANYRLAISAQVFPDRVHAVLSDLRSDILQSETRPLTRDSTFEDCVDAIASAVQSLLDGPRADRERMEGVCIAASGPTDASRGCVIFAPRFPKWPRNAPLRDAVAGHFPDMAVTIENEMRLQAIAERHRGKADDSAVVIEAGDKLVAGIVNRRGVVQGTHFVAGEIGHMILEPDSKVPCVCGAHGCFLAMVSERRAISLAREKLPQYPDSSLGRKAGALCAGDIFDAYQNGDGLAEAIMEDLASWFGQGFANIILMYDPKSIIIQGMYTRAGPRFLERVHHFITEKKYPLLSELNTNILYSALGADAGVLGGGLLVMNKYLDGFTL